ncbi:phosphoribosylformimino-5-aminoimidazole carboxamide ribotide isomerase [Desulfohalotomaculum tongense]|uniref:1-(5-phosphoribosyl)-5-[(5- phosphoribosylamino)methylideneamino]imidazole-4- carboxamide isomerase n=1 Tax=Desulforadius tongensis TaxID=1216062 RepID=UPI00195C0C17|nr:1-(5-phosphoribosyl)-5-[(5-phosphoribosylamino)methylideneamino]imidazole-4-carboxamide isomerase [Desulforadius tongensis]MBM7854267.1 phosphoribosylformimino-5-aminoimidazole carboxamide ribotide isomerase [Desulforadius tongensis]
MLVIPAIDLRNGKCVRLVEGRLDRETVYSDNPVETAKHWQRLGCQYLHVVDLDGAFAGEPRNLAVIKEIVSVLDIPVQVGGGIRDLSTVESLLNLGVHRVILGTAAIAQPEMVRRAVERFDEQIVLGIDAREGRVAVQGWAVESGISALELAGQMKEIGVKRVVFTDIRRDGTMKGPNLEATGELARGSGLKVIASGGVSTLDDLRRIKQMESAGVEGAIIGKALYTGRIDLKDALAVAAGREV